MDKKYFFGTALGDARMEKQNVGNWEAILKHVRDADAEGNSIPKNSWRVLDIGCHTGGMMKLFKDQLCGQIKTMIGVEPLDEARFRAKSLLPLDQFHEKIEDVPSQAADIVVSHEALYLVQDLQSWMFQLKRVLNPDGAAFIVLGSHGENTWWLRQRKRLDDLYGHRSYIHQPMDILNVGVEAGFDMEISRLNPEPKTHLRYSPPSEGWGEFETAAEMFAFSQNKLVFTFYPKR